MGVRRIACKLGHKFTENNIKIRYDDRGVLHRSCRTCNIQTAKKWRVGKIDKRDPSYIWARHLRLSYKMTPEQWQALLNRQNDVCAICGNKETITTKGKLLRLAIDHDHNCCSGDKTCGKCIRGLICSSCNNGIGRFKDNPALLRAAAEYIERYK